MDLSALSPAPWHATAGCCGNGGLYPYVFNINHKTRADAETDIEFIALSRNAFDVMMRRGWSPRRSDQGWFIDLWHHETLLPSTWQNLLPQADPYSALVEADRWYAENVEQRKV